MKKLIALLLLLCTLTLALSSCGAEPELSKPEDTNLEYWLLDRPNKKEWTELPNSHWLDDKDYLASGYELIIDENGNLSKPEKYIMFTVGNYPLHDLGVKRITTIRITDPDVYIWGLNINSSRDDVKSTLDKNGFIKNYDSEKKYVANSGNYDITVEYGSMIKIVYKMTSVLEQILVMEYGK